MKTKTVLSRMFAVGLCVLVTIAPCAVAEIYPCNPGPLPICGDQPGTPPAEACAYTLGTAFPPTAEKSCIDCDDPDNRHHEVTWTDTEQICNTRCPDGDGGISTGSFPTHTATNVKFGVCCKNCGS